MDYKAIQELIREMSQSDLYSLDIETDKIHIKMQRGAGQIMASPEETHAPLRTATAENREAIRNEENGGNTMLQQNERFVVSPMVGTFYAASSPENPPFVKVGDRVKKGQALCIIEAMKLMNEIVSEEDGEIVAILAENEAMVEFGQHLLKIRVEG